MAYAAAQDGLNRLNDRQNDRLDRLNDRQNDRLARQNDRFPLINRRNIQPSRYTRSLVSEALRVGMIDISLVDDIQMQVRGVLEEHLRLVRREYVRAAQNDNAGESPAVDEAMARSMLDSIFYSVDTYLLGFR